MIWLSEKAKFGIRSCSGNKNEERAQMPTFFEICMLSTASQLEHLFLIYAGFILNYYFIHLFLFCFCERKESRNLPDASQSNCVLSYL